MAKTPFDPNPTTPDQEADYLLSSWLRGVRPKGRPYPTRLAALKHYWPRLDATRVPWPPTEILDASRDVVLRNDLRWSMSPKLALALVGSLPKDFKALSLRKRTCITHLGLSKALDALPTVPDPVKDTRRIRPKLIKSLSYKLHKDSHKEPMTKALLHYPPAILHSPLLGVVGKLDANDLLNLSEFTGVPGYAFIRHAAETLQAEGSTYITWNAAVKLTELATCIPVQGFRPSTFLTYLDGGETDLRFIGDNTLDLHSHYLIALTEYAYVAVSPTPTSQG